MKPNMWTFLLLSFTVAYFDTITSFTSGFLYVHVLANFIFSVYQMLHDVIFTMGSFSGDATGRFVGLSVVILPVLLLLLLVVSYNRYRLKQRTDIQLKLQQELIITANRSLRQLNDSLHTLLREKEWLLQEIHHRVKNNLQIVISLLNTQSAYIDNDYALDAIRNSQRRMYAISLIYKKLYQPDHMATLDMSVYTRELVEYLVESFKHEKSAAIRLNISPVKLNIAQAVPLGLILNEAICNSLKYAFAANNLGQITVVLEQIEEEKYLLCIADNGKGLPEGFDPYNSGSLGMSLMKGLSQQLGGDFQLDNENGLRVCVTFKVLEFNN